MTDGGRVQLESGPVYSVIVPVYNAGIYLRPCLDSILAQEDAAPYEAILVDDGSTDGSGAVCDEYAANHPAFRVLHTENQGVSLARNAGMDTARGRYLLFLDADDLWAADMLSTMGAFLEKKPDMVMFFAQRFDDSGPLSIHRPKLLPTDGEAGDAYIRRCLAAGARPLTGAPWDSLYSREFLEHWKIRFPSGQKYGEDFDFVMQCLRRADSLYGTEHICCYYRQWPGSVTHTPTAEKNLMVCRNTVKWFREYPSAPFAERYIYYAMFCSKIGTRAEVKELTDFYEENQDILNYAKRPKFRLARLLFRLFGFYNGSRIIIFLIRFRHWRK